MNNYQPDRFVVIKISRNDKYVYRVFGTWYGGYLDGDSWRLNSGIDSVTLKKGIYHFHGSSGSVYSCGKDSYGTSIYSQGILENLINNSKKNSVKIVVMPEDTDFTTIKYNE